MALRCVLVFADGRHESREDIFGAEYVEDGLWFDSVGLARAALPRRANSQCEITRVFVQQPRPRIEGPPGPHSFVILTPREG